MAGLKKKELEEFKKILEEEKRKVLNHLQELSESSEEDLDVSTGDPVDIASLEISKNSLTKLGKRELSLVKKIDRLLVKVADGTYGICDNCGENIAIARLRARPVAELCIDCKTEAEKEEKRFGNREEVSEADEDAALEDEVEEG